MPAPYQAPHWNIFSNIPHQAAGPVGQSPARWAAKFGLVDIPQAVVPLPEVEVNRDQVFDHCQNQENPVLSGHLWAMAWGGQGAAAWGKNAVKASWDARLLLAPKLQKLRAGGIGLEEAYALFAGAHAVPGLGPAYFTKLLYFFTRGRNFYIMDQWTAKSVNLLTGRTVVRMAGNAVSNQNTPENYADYCREVDAIAAMLNVDGEKVEEMMMSKGGRNPWPWRAYVRKHWQN